jgi:hypothetical protein
LAESVSRSKSKSNIGNFDFPLSKEIYLSERREELNSFTCLFSKAKLSIFIISLQKQVAFFSDQGRVMVTSVDTLNLVEDEIAFKVTRFSLIDL